jgi:DNA polymerase I
MLVDMWFTGDDKPHIYTRMRDADGVLKVEEHHDFEPYFWVAEETPKFRIDRLLRQFPQARVDSHITAVGIDDTPLIRVVAHTPYDIIRMRQFFDKTWEADIRFTDRWLIDNVDKMPDWKPRKWWLDIECDTKEGFTTVFSIVDSDLDTPICFAWADDSTNVPSYIFEGLHETGKWSGKRTVRDVEYILEVYTSEADLHQAVMDCLRARDPDMLIAHGGLFFDFKHMVERFPKPELMSPVRMIRRPRKGYTSYRDKDQPIVGRWCFDTAAPASSGTGLERVWKDSGKGQLPNRKLNTIAKELGLGEKLTEEIEGMTVHNGWREYWEDFVDYCMLDTLLLRDMDEAVNCTDFYVEMVRLCGVSLESACNVTNFARGLLSRRTKRKAPTRHRGEDRETLKGAEVGLACVKGLHRDVAVIDYKGLYPSLILGHNLSYETKRSEAGPGIKSLDNGTYWDQTEKGLLPEVIEYLFDYRAKCQERMRSATTDEIRRGWNTTQMAIKRVMASLYGMTAHVGYGWADMDIAQTITSEGRKCIRLLDRVAMEEGYETVYGHTDSAFIKVPLEEAEALAEKITRVVQDATGNKMLFAELETWMPYWLLAKPNRYVGKVAWPEEDAGRLKVAGFEMKASNAAPISKELQEEMFHLICDGGSEGQVIDLVLSYVKRIKSDDISLDDISLTTRLGMNIHEYKVLSGGSKAAAYYNSHMEPDEPLYAGDAVRWTYVSATPSVLPPTQVVGFREEDELEGFLIDKDTIVEKMVKNKIASTFTVLEWDMNRAMGAARPKNYGW